MDAAQPHDRKRYHHWEILFMVLLVMAILCLAGGIFTRRISDFSRYTFLPIVLDSVLEADYSVDSETPRFPGLRLDSIWDAIYDRDPNANLEERKAALLEKLENPVPFVTPRACQGRHTIYAGADTWVDSTDPGAIYGSDLALRLERTESGVRRLLLYFPVYDVVSPGSGVAGARLELAKPPPIDETRPVSLCLSNLARAFDESSTSWANQPAAEAAYCVTAPSPGIHSWDVTELVNDWLRGRSGNAGLAVELPAADRQSLLYYSREADSSTSQEVVNAAQRLAPRLVIDCTGSIPPPEPRVALLPTATMEAPSIEVDDLSPTPSTLATGAPSSSPTPGGTATLLPPASATPQSSATVVPPTPTPVQATPSATAQLLPASPTATSTSPPAATSTSSPPTAPPSTATPGPTSPPPTSPPPTSPPSDTPTPSPTTPPSPPPEVDLVLSKSAAPDPVAAGDNLIYNLTVVNNGPADATGVVINDTLPAEVTFISATAGCAYSAGAVSCDVGNLAMGNNAPYVIVVAIDPGATGPLTNRAKVTGNESEPNLLNNEAAVNTTVATEIDLVITKTGTPGLVTPGETLTYTLTITNNGPSDATGVVISDTLPAEVTFSSAADCTGAAGVLICQVGRLTSSNSIQYRAVVTVNAATPPGLFTNRAEVTGNQTDPITGTNTATATTTVAAMTDADLSIIKSANSDIMDAGKNLTYQLTVYNNGPADAAGVVVTDTLPAEVSVVSAPSFCTQTGNTIVCELVDVILKGDSRPVNLVVNVDPATPSGIITNLAEVSSNENDPVPINNTASLDTAINGLANPLDNTPTTLTPKGTNRNYLPLILK